jgi:hypothetical protein
MKGIVGKTLDHPEFDFNSDSRHTSGDPSAACVQCHPRLSSPLPLGLIAWTVIGGVFPNIASASCGPTIFATRPHCPRQARCVCDLRMTQTRSVSTVISVLL